MHVDIVWRTIRAVTIAAAATLVAGAASSRDLPPITNVGAVSDVGDKIYLQHIGFMVFSNKRTPIDVPEWGIDAHITTAIETALKERYTLRTVDFPRGKIAPELGGLALFGGPSPDKTMRENAKPKDGETIDAYVVVWPFRREVYPTNQQVEGIGLLTQGERARLYTALMVTLLDGQTFKEIDTCALKIRPVSFGEPDGSYMNQANDLFAESYEAMTPEQKQKLEQSLRGMLNDGVAYCLKDLKLLN